MKTFSSLQIGSIRLANRLVRSATGERSAQKHSGCPTEAMAAFYGRLAGGEIGLIISGHTAVSHDGRCSETMTAFTRDDFIPSFARMVQACHDCQTPIICQLNHGGRQVDPTHDGIRSVGPSPVPIDSAREIPHELSESEINQIITDFGEAARRCREAGFDGVQIHSAHGYLVSAFNSPLTNRRTDQWGGSPQKRRTFMRAVYRSVREKVGPDYPILVKQNVSDFHLDGLSEAEAVEICQDWSELGVAAIELSGGISLTMPVAFQTKLIREKGEAVFFDSAARTIRQHVTCPLILTGGIRKLETCERLLGESVCDAIGLSRPLIREPMLPQKWKRGESHEAECMSCGGCKTDAEELILYCGILGRSNSTAVD